MDYAKFHRISSSYHRQVTLFDSGTEEQIKQGLITPFIQALGWCSGSQVLYEESVAKGRLDYLVGVNPARFMVEAKRIVEPLDGYVHQINRYLDSRPDIALGVLTNGRDYRFHLRGAEAHEEIFRFRIDDPEHFESISEFCSYLSPTADWGESVNYFESLRYKVRMRERLFSALTDPTGDAEFFAWLSQVTGCRRGSKIRGSLAAAATSLLADLNRQGILCVPKQEMSAPTQLRRRPRRVAIISVTEGESEVAIVVEDASPQAVDAPEERAHDVPPSTCFHNAQEEAFVTLLLARNPELSVLDNEWRMEVTSADNRGAAMMSGKKALHLWLPEEINVEFPVLREKPSKFGKHLVIDKSTPIVRLVDACALL
jgi:hypothetical protein